MDESNLYEELVRHIWKNSSLSNCGYDTMDEEMKRLFNKVVGRPVGDRSC